MRNGQLAELKHKKYVCARALVVERECVCVCVVVRMLGHGCVFVRVRVCVCPAGKDGDLITKLNKLLL